MKTRLLTVAILLLSPLLAWTQRQDLLSRSELLLGGGGMFYIGDLNNQSALTIPRGAGSAGFRVRLDNRWAFRLQATYGLLASGDKDYIPLRNLHFRSDLWEAAVVAEFNFAPFGPMPTDRRWTPYLFGGLAVFHFNPQASIAEPGGGIRWVDLQPLHTEWQGSAAYPDRRVYRLTQVSLPFGLGIKWRLGKHFSLAAEYGFRKTWTDYLDDVSTTYADHSTLQANASDGPLAVQLADRSGEVEPGYVNAPGIKRGDDSLDDWYAYLHVSLGISLETLFGWMRTKRCKN